MSTSSERSLSCPLPARPSNILLAHGGGGRLMHQLLDEVFFPVFRNTWLDTRHDAAVTDIAGVRVAFTTDSYVVRPLFFPGGDIGKLAVCGTVNDLAVCGARPKYLSAAFILEEGVDVEVVRRVVQSMQQTAVQCQVHFVCGDTKVVDKGKGDAVFVNTSGIGLIPPGISISPQHIRPGDAIVVSGDVGRHGITILAARENLEFQTTLESDCAPLTELTLALLDAGIEVHCMRDLTRGGLAAALVELALASHRTFQIHERAVPVDEQVQGACELLGLDPWHVACEGRLIAFLPAAQLPQALSILHAHPQSRNAACIGQVLEDSQPVVVRTSPLGTRSIVELPSGEQLPRIC